MFPVLRPLPPRDSALMETLRARMRASRSMAPTLQAVLLLLAAREVGQNLERLARYTGLDRSFVSRCARRLVDNGVWGNGETIGDWLADGATHPGFWNDVAVAEGKLCRRINEQGLIEWAPPGCWRKNYDFITSEPVEELNVRYHLSPTAEPDSWEASGVEAEGESHLRQALTSDRESADRPVYPSGSPNSRQEKPLQQARLYPPPRRNPTDTGSVDRGTPPRKLPELFPDAVWLR